MGTAMRVDINPVMAAPIPAIWPTGCIAKALKLPKRKPIAKNWRAKNVSSTIILGFEAL